MRYSQFCKQLQMMAVILSKYIRQTKKIELK